VFFFVDPDDSNQYPDGNINDSETRFAILKQNHDDAARIISAGAWNRMTGKKVEENHRSKGLIQRINRLIKAS
jgi:PHD/YefM family antitoxin component YafN of YafNO toxin-antitoxin module